MKLKKERTVREATSAPRPSAPASAQCEPTRVAAAHLLPSRDAQCLPIAGHSSTPGQDALPLLLLGSSVLHRSGLHSSAGKGSLTGVLVRFGFLRRTLSDLLSCSLTSVRVQYSEHRFTIRAKLRSDSVSRSRRLFGIMNIHSFYCTTTGSPVMMVMT